MVQVLVQLDEVLARQLDAVAPGRSRKRSLFIRMAIQKALMDLEETRTRAAYAEQTDDEPAYFSAGAWERSAPRAAIPRARRK